MPRSEHIRFTSESKFPLMRTTSRSWCADEEVRLYGWDSRNQVWHGPTELRSRRNADKRLVQALTAAPGRSWYGPIHCCTSDQPSSRFFALIHDLQDCAIASIYCDESKAGPAEILAVIPADRIARLREDFAFEFLAYARFLGTISAGAELQVHESMTEAIAEGGNCGGYVFSISSGMLPADMDLVLSCCAEKVALAMCGWLAAAA